MATDAFESGGAGRRIVTNDPDVIEFLESRITKRGGARPTPLGSASAWVEKSSNGVYFADRETTQDALALVGLREERMFHDHGSGEVEVNG